MALSSAIIQALRDMSPTTVAGVLRSRGRRISRSAVSQWLLGSTMPKPALLADLCTVLELSAPEAADLYAAAGVPLAPVLLSLLPPREPSPEPQLTAEGA